MQLFFIIIGLIISPAAHLIHVKSYEVVTIYIHQVMTDEVLYNFRNTQEYDLLPNLLYSQSWADWW